MKYKLSVIIPVYNAEKYLRQAIDSVINQKGLIFSDEIQIILINNATQDNSGEICKEYEKRYPKNIVYEELKINNGPSKARNVGLSYAKGECVNFLDADDCWDEYALYKAYQILKDNWDYVDLVVCRVKKFEKEDGWELYDRRFKKGNRIVDILEEPDSRQCKVTNCMIKTEVAKKIQFDEEVRHAEDMKYITEVILKKGKMFLLKDAIFLYRVREDGSSLWQSIKKSRNWYNETVKKVLEYLINLSIYMYGSVIPYIQHLIYGDLHDRLPLIKSDVLTQDEFEEYRSYISRCMGVVTDEMIFEDPRVPLELKVYALILKYQSNPKKILSFLEEGLIKKRFHYLFPFEMIKPGEDIYLYGGGDIGQQYLNEIYKGNYCNVLGVIDKKKSRCIVNFEACYSLDEFKICGTEKVVISILDKDIAENVKKELIKRGIKEENIVWEIYRIN